MKQLFFKLFLPCAFLLAGVGTLPSQIQNKPTFNPDLIYSKWKEGDSVYLKNYILHLSDIALTEVDFFSRIAELSDVTGFVFGNSDVTDVGWQNRSEEEKMKCRETRAQVYLLYTQSKVFMKKLSWIDSLAFQSWYQKNIGECNSNLSEEIQNEIIHLIGNLPLEERF